MLEQRLMEIYRDGPNTNFKPPGEFEAGGGKVGRRKKAGVGGAEGGGRLTPEPGGVGSGPATPVGRRGGGGEGYFGSPLR